MNLESSGPGLGVAGGVLICEYRGELVRSTIPTPGVYCNRPLLPRAGPSFTGLGDFGGVFEIRGSFTGSPTERPEAVNRSIASVRPGVLERADVVTPGVFGRVGALVPGVLDRPKGNSRLVEVLVMGVLERSMSCSRLVKALVMGVVERSTSNSLFPGVFDRFIEVVGDVRGRSATRRLALGVFARWSDGLVATAVGGFARGFTAAKSMLVFVLLNPGVVGGVKGALDPNAAVLPEALNPGFAAFLVLSGPGALGLSIALPLDAEIPGVLGRSIAIPKALAAGVFDLSITRVFGGVLERRAVFERSIGAASASPKPLRCFLARSGASLPAVFSPTFFKRSGLVPVINPGVLARPSFASMDFDMTAMLA